MAAACTGTRGSGQDGRMSHDDLTAGPPATYLLGHAEADGELAAGAAPAGVAAKSPDQSAAWATLAERAFANGEVVMAYAYARTGYPRGLDQLRRSGWRGHGPVPWQHEPNRGLLRCLYILGRAVDAIG